MIDMLINECTVNNVPINVTQAIIQVESKRNPLAININKLGIKFTPKNKEEAIQIAKKYIAKGYTVDMGLMQFNSENLDRYNYKVEDLYDPCTNIKAGTTIFSENFNNTNKSENIDSRILKSLSAYNTGNFTFGFKNGYVDKFKDLLNNYNWQLANNIENNSPNNNNNNNDKAKELLALTSQTKIELAYSVFVIENGKYVRKQL